MVRSQYNWPRCLKSDSIWKIVFIFICSQLYVANANSSEVFNIVIRPRCTITGSSQSIVYFVSFNFQFQRCIFFFLPFDQDDEALPSRIISHFDNFMYLLIMICWWNLLDLEATKMVAILHKRKRL